MSLREPANSGDSACTQAENAIRDISAPTNNPAFNTDELRKQFIDKARIVRKLSDNFVPDIFLERRLARVPPDIDCMENMLKTNRKALGYLKATLHSVSNQNILDERNIRLYESRCAREERRLVLGEEFFTQWCDAQKEAPSNVVPLRAAEQAPEDIKSFALRA